MNLAAIEKRFITDEKGKKISVILPLKEYEKLLEQIDDLEDVKLFDEAKKTDDGKRILLSDYIRKIPK